METVPKDGTPVLVLMPEADKWKHRIQTATYATNHQKQVIGVVGNQFAFDMPTPIGWIVEADLYPDA